MSSLAPLARAAPATCVVRSGRRELHEVRFSVEQLQGSQQAASGGTGISLASKRAKLDLGMPKTRLICSRDTSRA